ncbi:MAG: iron-sulfur cluster assembly protein [Ilumatobacteraceae bacterium]
MNTGHSDDAELVAVLDRVDDPEYPGVSIRDLGMVQAVTRDADGLVRVSLVPTFGGCPALPMMRPTSATPMWPPASRPRPTTSPWNGSTRRCGRRIGSRPPGARRWPPEFTVVLRDKDGSLRCPVCGSRTVRGSFGRRTDPVPLDRVVRRLPYAVEVMR